MVTTQWLRSGTLAAAILVGLAAACGRGDEAEDDGTADRTATADFPDTAGIADRTPDTDAGARPTVRAELEPRAGTDVIGSAVLTPRPGATAVTVEIHGANSGWPYVAELIAGSCNSPGGVLAMLGEITAGESGDGEYHQVVDRALLEPDGENRAVWVRGADDPTAIVACGNLGPPAARATSTTGR